jgi:hypothetical protein
MRAPHPNGCYVMIFDAPSFRANADVLNGPGRWASLNELRDTNEFAFGGASFRGPATEFHSSGDHAMLSNEMSANIESLEIICKQFLANR